MVVPAAARRSGAAVRKLEEVDRRSGAAARKLEVVVRTLVAVVVKVDQPVADIPGNTAAANSNKAEVEADTVDVYPEVRAIYNSRNLPPTTIPRRLVSKSTGNNHSPIVRRRLRSASS